MNKLSQREFGNMRGSLQPVGGGKDIYGWTKIVQPTFLTMVLSTADPIEIGKAYVMSLHGRRTSAVFEARAMSVEPFDLNGHGTESTVAGTNVKIIEAEKTVIRFHIMSTVRYASATERFHVLVSGIKATVTIGGESMVASLVDAAENGVAITQFAPLQVGLKVQLAITTAIGKVISDGIVRNCRDNNDGSYRIGIEMIQMGRIDGPRWNRFLSEI